MALHFHPLRVTSVERDTDDAMVVGFEAPADGFGFEPGQYLTLRASVAGQPQLFHLLRPPPAGRHPPRRRRRVLDLGA